MVPRSTRLAALLACLCAGSAAALTIPSGQGRGRARPATATAWPFDTLQVGLLNPQGGAAQLRASAPFALRYAYLSGGVNTGGDWIGWATGGGSFVPDYVAESTANGLVPVFSYYELRQSLPGASISEERSADVRNLEDAQTMRSWFENFEELLRLLDGTGAPTIVVHVEPDLWGYIEQRVGTNASRQPVAVAATGLPELRGFANNASGFARAIVTLRDRYAPHVLLAYQLSVFGTDKDLHYSHLDRAQTRQIAIESARFYRSLRAHFDLMFAEFTNSDAGYQLKVLHLRDPFWTAADYARQVLYLSEIHRRTHVPFVLWQIPVGNTIYRTDNDTPYHYQDNRVQWLLGADHVAHLRAYERAGVIALLFGSGIPTGTCACTAGGQGVYNPPPIDGNTAVASSPDDDGGYLVQRVRAYYAAGPLRLPAAVRAQLR